MSRKLPESFYNLTSAIGAIVTGVSVGLIFFIMALEGMSDTPKPYMGIIAFVILPAIMLIGISLFIDCQGPVDECLHMKLMMMGRCFSSWVAT